VLEYTSGRPATSLVYSTLLHGKPLLDNGPEFNTSNSGPMLLIVVGAQTPLGADIEVLGELDDIDKLSRHYFSEAEQSALATLEGAERRRGFYQIWTRKEAVLKALGLGLNLELRSFSVPLDNLGSYKAVGNVEAKTQGCLSYLVRPLDVGPDCEASLASRLPLALEEFYRIGDGLEWTPQ
jgi:phosphopantetheinyl transferase